MKKFADNVFTKVRNAINNTYVGLKLSFSAAKFETNLLIIVFFLEQIPTLIMAFALKMIIDNLIAVNQFNTQVIIGWLIAYLEIIIVQRLASNITGYLTASLRKKFEANIDIITIEKVARSNLDFFDSSKDLNALRTVQKESGVINTIIFVGLRIFSSILSLITIVGIMFSFSVVITFIYIILIIPSIVCQAKFNFLIWQYDFTHSEDYRKADAIYDEITSHSKMMENHLYNNFHPFKLEFSNSWKKWHKEKSQMYKNHSIKMFLSYSLQFLVTTAILIIAIFQYVEGIIALGSIQFFVNTALNLRSNVMSLFDNVTSISIYSERVNVLNEFLYKKEKPIDNGVLLFPNSFTIKFDKVWFKYPNTDNWILKNCSFEINKGDKIAFVGLNGAGKTTIIKLLLRFYEVDDGYIQINDIPISKYNKDDLYRNITSMFQDPITYNTTLQENITLSKIDSSESHEQLLYSYEFAGLKDLVQEMPKGLHTQIGKQFDEQGYVPSGGQSQKIALARAIYRNSEIMILDEPVASIDPETEYEIFTKAIKKWESKTIILISHRLSNVIHCDNIIVLQNGNVIESGSHKELMNENGEYAKLFYTQAKKYIL